MSPCAHSVATPAMKFCPDCGRPVNVVQREPGELRALRSDLASLCTPHEGSSPITIATSPLVLAWVSATIRWALGEMSTEDYRALFPANQGRQPSTPN